MRDRLAAAEARIDELTGRLGELHIDDVGRAQALAEDGQARADNAQATADSAFGRLVDAEARAVDALERANNAREVTERLQARVVDVEGRVADSAAHADNSQRLADKALRRAAVAQSRGEDALATARLALDMAREALLPARMAAFDAWLELCPPADGPSLSVILPTRDRPALLPRAVASVMEQLYEDWQLVVVDDGDTDAVERVLAEVEDERIAVVQGGRRGPDAARNAGLDHATGDVVCYLDDDNVMNPAWLRAVAHVFAARPDVDVAYGVSVAEHRTPDALDGEGWWPAFWQLPWSREHLLEQNLTDVGALAHRRELPEARFEEGTATAEDWDLLIRLTADRPALAVPALSHAYSVGGPGHASSAAGHREAIEAVRRRHAGERR